jgi:Mn2+/Fe2+ NRAMP family transporter
VRTSEQLTVGLLVMVVGCFLVDLCLSKPPLRAVLGGLTPRLSRDSVYAAVCLLGANVMPHNFLLHRWGVKEICVAAAQVGTLMRTRVRVPA